MLDRLAIYGVPLLAGIVVAAVLLGPGQERPVTGARVRGVLVSSARQYAVRVETVRHYAERFHPMPTAALRLEWLRAGRVIGTWNGASDAQGIAEAQGKTEEDLGEAVELRVVDGQEELLCQGTAKPGPELRRLVWPDLTLERAEEQEPVEVAVVLPRSAAVPPFPEALRVDAAVRRQAATGGPSDATPRLRLSAEGAELGRAGDPVRRRCSEQGCVYRWTVDVTAQALTVELSADVETATGQRGHWEGLLPVAVGGLWLDPAGIDGDRLAVRSATPRHVAYVSLLGTQGRLWGSPVALREDERGYASGEVPLPPSGSEALVAVLSSDATEPIGATVAWPLRPDAASLQSVRLEVLADGLPAAIAREKKRERGARRPAYGLILAAGFFELLYLYRRNRLDRLKLQREMRRIVEAAAELPEPDSDSYEPVTSQGLPSPATAEDPGALDESELGSEAADRTEATAAAMAAGVGLWWLTVLAAGVAFAFLVLAAVAAWG